MGEGRAGKAEQHPELERIAHSHYKWLFFLAFLSLLIVSALLLLSLFKPPLPYAVSWSPPERNSTPQFLRTLFALTGGWIDYFSRAEPLTNGDSFYPAELAAIRGAQRSVHMTAYIFSDGKIAAQFIDALAGRARAGVDVKVVIDTVGSAGMTAARLKALTDAGGRVAWYRPLRWYTWPRLGNRTHRELLIIDGRIGFIGGAGVADHWRFSKKGDPRWRDLMVRVEGEAVAGLQTSFVENWLEAAGEILANFRDFPEPVRAGNSVALVVDSPPTNGGATPARILFQTLLASATRRIHISTPYFLPDHALRDEIARAAQKRHVEVMIVVPGRKSDHWMVWHASRRLYGDLLRSGVQIYEYRPAMNHTKCMLVDDLWAVVGSTNLDSRSFGLNDEVNLAVRDGAFAALLEKNFQADLADSDRVSYEEWKSRGPLHRIEEWIGAVFERQE